MPGTEQETCEAKSAVSLGRFHEADIECGLEKGHADEEHVTAQKAIGRDPKTGRRTEVTIIFTWK